LDAEFKYVSRLSLSPALSLKVKGPKYSAPRHWWVFTVGAMKNSRIYSPRKMVSYFVMMLVPLWKFLVMNKIQINGAYSLIRQK